MDAHDPSYKLLFSHARMVRDLLTGFAPADLVARFDLDKLEKVNASYVSDDLQGRHGDAVWRVPCGDDWIYLLLEFQSTIDRHMALRMLVYTGLLHQDRIKHGKPGRNQPLPRTLSIVLYNGERRWRAPTDMRSLIETSPDGLDEFQPDMRFLLIDEGACALDLSGQDGNLVAALFRLEHHRSAEEVLSTLKALVNWLDGPEHDSLRRAFLAWLQRRLPRWFPGETLPVVHDLQESYEMVTDRFAEWKEEWKERQRIAFLQEGLEQGRAQGREQGREQGLVQGRELGREQGLVQGRSAEARRLLSRLLKRRFGRLAPTVELRLRRADTEQLEEWMDQLLDADGIDDIFG